MTDRMDDPERAEKIRRAFIHFGKAVARGHEIKMAECKTCGGEHPVDMLDDIRWASKRVKYRKLQADIGRRNRS